ncbi:MAG TPA: hypothetical protein VKB63_08665 [Gemmatimonadales bacterium]|nr:hypothetical protein [Gemmatimonadales bacterium]
MTIAEADVDLVSPVLAWMGKPYNTDKARVLLLAIGQQETAFRRRVQMGKGPARSFWQIEPGKTAGAGIFQLYPGMEPFRHFAAMRDFPTTRQAVSTILATPRGDDLAVIISRGLLWIDPAPLPKVGDAKVAWAYYLRTWRPGKPRPGAWFGESGSYARAHALIA